MGLKDLKYVNLLYKEKKDPFFQNKKAVLSPQVFFEEKILTTRSTS